MGISYPIEIELSGYEELMNEEIAALVEGVGSDTLSIKYPLSSIKAGQIGGIRDMEYYINGSSRICWGISFWRPFGISGSLTANSVEMKMKTDAGLREETTLIVLGNDITGDMEINLDQSRIGCGWKFKGGINAALGIDIYHLSIGINGRSKTEGFIRQFGEDTDIIQSFNNPVESENFRNTLDNEWISEFDDNLAGFNGGLSYSIGEEIVLDLGFSQSFEETISGSSTGLVHKIGAVNYESITGESDEELFNELLLEPSKMTYTNQTEYLCSSLVMNYPGYIRLGLGMEQNRTKQQFVLTTYFGELSYRYKGKVIERGREKLDSGFTNYERISQSDYTYGVKFNSRIEYSLRRGFGSRAGFFINLQYLNFDEVLDNIKKPSGEEEEGAEAVQFLSFSSGLSYKISENLLVDIRVFGFPGTFLESRLTYRFGS